MSDKDTKIKGNITELEILTYITKLGYQVSVPFGDRARYDQIWDVNGKLLRVQIKTTKLSDEPLTDAEATSRFEIPGFVISTTVPLLLKGFFTIVLPDAVVV